MFDYLFVTSISREMTRSTRVTNLYRMFVHHVGTNKENLNAFCGVGSSFTVLSKLY